MRPLTVKYLFGGSSLPTVLLFQSIFVLNREHEYINDSLIKPLVKIKNSCGGSHRQDTRFLAQEILLSIQFSTNLSFQRTFYLNSFSSSGTAAHTPINFCGSSHIFLISTILPTTLSSG